MRTVSRAKHPGTHSYPVGLKQIECALELECGQVEVFFECYPVGLQKQGSAYRVLTFAAAADGAAKLSIAAIRRDLKPVVRDLILTEALPYIRRACTTVAQGTRIEFHFDELKQSLLGPRAVGFPDVPNVHQA